jgi:hypothetical protein
MTTTTKRGFFTALVAAAAAAIAKAQTTIITPCRPKIQWGGQIPLCNGQCPQPDCGYRAPEFPKRELHWDELEKYQTPGELYWDYRYPNQLIPGKRLNRCPNCNTAFWQDPQEEKG